MKDLKIAAVCMHSERGEIKKNLERMERFVSRASASGLDMICFPELSVTGYTLDKPMDVYGDLPPDDAMQRVVRMAQERAMIIIAGIVEMAQGGKPYISQIVAGPGGLIGVHRKTHISPQEKERYRPGERIEVFSYGEAKFGIQLCYEAHFPEISRVMALKGTDIVFMPHASPRGNPEQKIQSWQRHLPSRAFDNGIFIVACNQVGKTKEGFSFPGTAVVLNPAGWIIAKYGGNKEKLVMADLKMGELREIRRHKLKYFIPNRRPELYKELTTSSD